MVVVVGPVAPKPGVQVKVLVHAIKVNEAALGCGPSNVIEDSNTPVAVYTAAGHVNGVGRPGQCDAIDADEVRIVWYSSRPDAVANPVASVHTLDITTWKRPAWSA